MQVKYRISALKLYSQLEDFLKNRGFVYIEDIFQHGDPELKRKLNIDDDVINYLRYKINKFYQFGSSDIEEKTVETNLPSLEKEEYKPCSLVILNVPFKVLSLFSAYGIHNIKSVSRLSITDFEDILKDKYYIAVTLSELKNVILRLNTETIDAEKAVKYKEYIKLTSYPIDLLNLAFNFFTTLRELGIITIGELCNSHFFERLDNFEDDLADKFITNLIKGFKESINLPDGSKLPDNVSKRLSRTPVSSFFPCVDKSKAKKHNINTLEDLVSKWMDNSIKRIDGLALTENISMIIKLNSVIISDLHLLDFYPLPDFTGK